jgi:hypothetical protein
MSSFQVTELLVPVGADCQGNFTIACVEPSDCPGGTECELPTDPGPGCEGNRTIVCVEPSDCPGGTECDLPTNAFADPAAQPRGAGGALVVEPPELTELRMLLADAIAVGSPEGGAG